MPRDAEILFFRGTARFRAGDIADAIADFDAVLALRPHDPDALAARGLARVTAGDLANGEADFSAVLMKDPKVITVLTYRGQLRVLRGDYTNAARDLTIAAALSPESAEIAVWRTIAEQRAGIKNTEALAAARARLTDTGWPLPAVRYFLGEISASELAAHAGSDAETSDAFYYLGEAALARGDRAEAIKQFTAATATSARGSFAYIGARIELAKLTQ
jgi:lipoprotein NlpI